MWPESNGSISSDEFQTPKTDWWCRNGDSEVSKTEYFLRLVQVLPPSVLRNMSSPGAHRFHVPTITVPLRRASAPTATYPYQSSPLGSGGVMFVHVPSFVSSLYTAPFPMPESVAALQ